MYISTNDITEVPPIYLKLIMTFKVACNKDAQEFHIDYILYVPQTWIPFPPIEYQMSLEILRRNTKICLLKRVNVFLSFFTALLLFPCNK